jgi:spore germination protein KB
MKISDGKIGIREFTAIIMLTIGVKLSDSTPSLLFTKGTTATWMMPLVSVLVYILPLLILLKLLKKYQTLNLVEIIYTTTGKYFGALLCILLFLIMFIGTALNSRSYVDIVSPLFFTRTPLVFLYILLIGGSVFVAKRGFETIGRTAWIIIPYIKIVLFLLICFVWGELDWVNMFPIGGKGLDNVLKNGFLFNSIFGEIIILTVAFPFVRNYKSYTKATMIGLTISALEISLFVLIYIVAFSYPSVDSLAFPFQHLTRLASIGDFFDKTEPIYLGFWVMASVIHFAIYLYVTVLLFSYMLKLKEPEPLVLPFGGLILLVGMIPHNLNQTIFLSRENFLIASSIIIPSIPFILWLGDKMKTRRKKQRENV